MLHAALEFAPAARSGGTTVSSAALKHGWILMIVCNGRRQPTFHTIPHQHRSDRRQPETGMIAKSPGASEINATRVLLAESMTRVALMRDRAAFENVFRHFAPRVKTYCMRLGADASLAEEITQETMVSVWSNADQFDLAKANVSTWIFTIARNLSIDRFRKSRRPQFDPGDPAFIPDDPAGPDEMLERDEMNDRVRDVLKALSPSERDVIMLSYYQNFSHSKIAKQLDVPLGTVKSRIRLAFGKIRSVIKTSEGSGGQ
jgi:RNA polymerase sigma factor (sigma-70 family)